MCSYHYERHRKASTVCVVEDCERPQFCRKWCQRHYWRWRRYGDVTANHDPVQEPICTIDGCNEPTRGAGRGLCKRHYLIDYNRRRPPDPEGQRARGRKHILKGYGLTPEQYHALAEAQDHRCAICGTTEPGGRSWTVDHDHQTGKVRGLLCRKCNTGLGLLGDNVKRIEAVMRYLREG